jgi:phage terminase large subunit GpA-like protein
VNGKKRLAWELPPGKRNEALDCRAYAIAALNILNPRFEAIKNRGVPFGVVDPEKKPGTVKRTGTISSGVQI